MGMFDNIRCDMPMPDGRTSPLYQTKEFECDMSTYRITKDGLLILEVSGYHQRPLNGPIDFHGMIDFYDEFSRYIGKFTDGKLVNLTAVPWR